MDETGDWTKKGISFFFFFFFAVSDTKPHTVESDRDERT